MSIAPVPPQTTIRAYKERQRKPDDQCSILTLAMRRYTQNKVDFYRRHSDVLKQNARDRYKNNPEYRLKKLANMKTRRDAVKAAKLTHVVEEKTMTTNE